MGAMSPDNVHETGVSPDGQSRPPIVSAEAEQVERTRRETWSRARSEGFVPYRLLFRMLRAEIRLLSDGDRGFGPLQSWRAGD
jgi:hypothetical protein